MDSLAQRGVISAINSSLSYTWTVMEFSTICDILKPLEYIRSPPFISCGCKGTWCLKLYPNTVPDNNRADIGSWISILPEYYSENGVEVTITVSVPIITTNTGNRLGNSSSYTSGVHTLTFTGNKESKCDPYIYKNYIQESNGSITITCSITEKVKYEHIHKNIQNAARLQEFDKFELLLQNNEHTDITFVIGSEKLHAYKGILSVNSPVFAAMFKHNMLEKQNNVVEIEDIEANVMAELIRFLHTGKVDDIETIAVDLFVAADKYSVDGLKNLCEDVMCKNLSVSNVFDNLHFAIKYKLKKLSLEVLDFMASNRENLKAGLNTL